MTSILLDKTASCSATSSVAARSDAGYHSDFGKILMLPIERITSNPMRSRKQIDDNSIITLADSIRRHGILQPISVRYSKHSSNDYEIIAGERRFLAAKLLGLSFIPSILIDADDLKSAELSIIENLHRDSLHFFEQAAAISCLIDAFGFTQEDAAKILSSSQSFIANKLRILKLTLPEREKIITYGLSERHARALLCIQSPEQRLRMIEYINTHHLNVSTTEAYIEKYLSDSTAKDNHSPRKVILKDIRVFYNSINRAITAIKQAGIEVVTQTVDLGESVELTIRVPKSKDVSRETSQP